ncbi:MAG: menaquinone biosynthetic enzyme MqnA/MqnD family protein [Chitinophagaceae bacterium]
MDRKIRIGAVSYLNTKPLIYGLSRLPIKDEISLICDYPAQIASKLKNDEIDIGLIPVAVINQLNQYHIIGSHCIACNGPVHSVAIFSEKPLNEITTILMDYQSRTSVMLARILLKEFWKLSPEFVETSGEDFKNLIKDNVAGIVIGDRALEQNKKSTFIYDLGEAWLSYTGLPFVFAAWVSNKKIPVSFIKKFEEANQFGLNELEKVIALEKYPPDDLLEYYTKYIKYNLDDLKLKGLNLFLKKLENFNTKGLL